ncbi:MAG: phosphoribosyltransferase family protein [Burkholderiales bacterium]
MAEIHDLPDLRDALQVFRDRADAGRVLASMLEPYKDRNALVLAIPSGGVPVAAEIARALGAELDVAVVSKILLPWTTESGFGAVAFDGSVWIDERAARNYDLKQEDVAQSLADAKEKVARRVERLRAGRPPLEVKSRPVILVDDGIAAGSTVRTAIAALRHAGAGEIIVAVPTGHRRAVTEIAKLADAVYCANVRASSRFAVAEAYEEWRDVSESEAAALR